MRFILNLCAQTCHTAIHNKAEDVTAASHNINLIGFRLVS